MYKQLKDEYFGFVRQAGELDLQLKEMEVVEKFLSLFKIPFFAGIESNFFLSFPLWHPVLNCRKTSRLLTILWVVWRGICGLLRTKMGLGRKQQIPGR